MQSRARTKCSRRYARTWSACQLSVARCAGFGFQAKISVSPEPSHVLKAMGLSRDRVNGSIRFSLGRGTTPEEIDRAVEAVNAAVERLRKKK